MPFGSWDTVLNAVVLVFWMRIWTSEDRSFILNPHVAPLARLSDAVLDFLRPVFGRLPSRAVAAAVTLFLLVFRGFTVPASSGGILRIGFELATPRPSIPYCVAFSLLSFAIFLFSVWGICLIYLRPAASRAQLSNTHDAMLFIGRPFTDLPFAARPAALLGFGVLLGLLLDISGRPLQGLALPVTNSVLEQPAAKAALGLALSALEKTAELLGTISSLVVVLIIGSLVAMFAGSRVIHFFCRDWLDFLLGPASRWQIHIGAIDLSPLVFLFAIGALQVAARTVIGKAYLALF
jgi:uncharacterized protein YggT (Ycf19 family)